MNAALKPPPELTSSGIRPADRLGFTLFVATLLHLALILGVSFTLAEPGQLSKTLEITLSTFKSDKAPKEADFLAQNNQEGSGTLEHKAAPKTTEQAPFQDSKVNKVTPATAPQPTQRKEAAVAKTSLTTTKQQQQKAATKQKEEEPQPDAQPAPVFDTAQLSAEIASLEAELAQEQQLYAKRYQLGDHDYANGVAERNLAFARQALGVATNDITIADIQADRADRALLMHHSTRSIH